MNLQTLLSELGDHEAHGPEDFREAPVVAMHEDGVMYEVVGVRQVEVEGVTVLILDKEEHDCSRGSYGGAEDAEDAAETRQTGLQQTIADRAGLSDLHRP